MHMHLHIPTPLWTNTTPHLYSKYSRLSKWWNFTIYNIAKAVSSAGAGGIWAPPTPLPFPILA